MIIIVASDDDYELGGGTHRTPTAMTRGTVRHSTTVTWNGIYE